MDAALSIFWRVKKNVHKVWHGDKPIAILSVSNVEGDEWTVDTFGWGGWLSPSAAYRYYTGTKALGCNIAFELWDIGNFQTCIKFLWDWRTVRCVQQLLSVKAFMLAQAAKRGTREVTRTKVLWRHPGLALPTFVSSAFNAACRDQRAEPRDVLSDLPQQWPLHPAWLLFHKGALSECLQILGREALFKPHLTLNVGSSWE